MFDTVVVGVDGRRGGHDAAALAWRIAAPGATIHRVAISSPSPDAEEVHAASSVAAGLHAAAKQYGAGVIVVGSSHRGAVTRSLCGDEAVRALRGAPCAVAVAPPGYADDPFPIRHIGLAWDGRPQSEDALIVTRALARGLMARATAVTVAGTPVRPADGSVRMTVTSEIDVDDNATRIDELEDVLSSCSSDLAVGTLSHFAQDVDLLVVGSRQQGPIGRITLGSTSEDLVRRLERPLLVVPRAIVKQAATG